MRNRKHRIKRIKPRVRREVANDTTLSLLVPDTDLVYKDLRKTALVTLFIIIILIVVTTLPAVQ